MSQEPRMKKQQQSESLETMVVNTKDGELSMLTKPMQNKLRDSTKTLVSM